MNRELDEHEERVRRHPSLELVTATDGQTDPLTERRFVAVNWLQPTNQRETEIRFFFSFRKKGNFFARQMVLVFAI